MHRQTTDFTNQGENMIDVISVKNNLVTTKLHSQEVLTEWIQCANIDQCLVYVLKNDNARV